MADIIIEKLYKSPAFTWGRNQIQKEKELVRKEYIEAIKIADLHNVKPLLIFART